MKETSLNVLDTFVRRCLFSGCMHARKTRYRSRIPVGVTTGVSHGHKRASMNLYEGGNDQHHSYRVLVSYIL